MLRVTLVWTSIRPRGWWGEGGVKATNATKIGISSGLMNHLVRVQKY